MRKKEDPEVFLEEFSVQKEVVGSSEHIIPQRGQSLRTNTRCYANLKTGDWPASVYPSRTGFLSRGCCQLGNKPPRQEVRKG